MGRDLRAQLVLDALNMAIGQRRPRKMIHRLDRGSQHTSVAYGPRRKEAGVRPSMGSVGHVYDNAMCERFFTALACELLQRSKLQIKAEARNALFVFIEGWCVPSLRHSALGCRSPDSKGTPAIRFHPLARGRPRNGGTPVGARPGFAIHFEAVERAPEGRGVVIGR